MCNMKVMDIRKLRRNFRFFSVSLVESTWFKGALLIIIVVDALCVGIQTSQYTAVKSEWYISVVNQLFTAIYQFEILLQLNVWGLKFFRNWWNNFNLTLVIIYLVGLFISLVVQSIGTFDNRVFQILSVLKFIKALQALRVIRIIRYLKSLQVIVLTLLASIPAIGAIVITISLVLYIFAIIGRDLYGRVSPSRYGNLGKAIFTLFQLMTLDDWFEMYSTIESGYQHILVFLILFIVIETLIFINLFVAVIVDNLARAQSAASIARIQYEEIMVADHDSDDVITDERYRESSILSQYHLYSQNLFKKMHDPMEQYLMSLNSLDFQLNKAHEYRNTLDKLVDMVDLSKS